MNNPIQNRRNKKNNRIVGLEKNLSRINNIKFLGPTIILFSILPLGHVRAGVGFSRLQLSSTQGF